ncbi:MAG TPA: class I SAM-dependent methyltransferase [Terracidiphilus sp.]|jgi:predicted O-methyltransferase YrrM|nr:class I SAM-dependent methyltransferase [Terracidiphilus sp.]
MTRNPLEGDAFFNPPAELSRINARTTELGFTMASEPRTGSLLQVLAASKPGGRFLELGTGTGLSTAWLLSGMDASSTLISVDTDPQVQAVAREILGNDTRLTLVLEDGAAFLHRQIQHSFDLVFADAMPGKYEALDDALALVKPGGFYVIDDMLPQPNWPEGHDQKALTLLYRLSSNPTFHLAPMAWASGIAVLVRRPTHEPAPEK